MSQQQASEAADLLGSDFEDAWKNRQSGAVTQLIADRHDQVHPFRPWLSPNVVKGIIKLSEFSIIVFVGVMAGLVLEKTSYLFNWQVWFVLLAMGVTLPAMFNNFNLYSLTALRGHSVTSIRLISVYLGMAMGAILVMYLIGQLVHVSTRWLLAWAVSTFLCLALWRLFLSLCLRYWSRAARIAKRVVIVGAGEQCQSLVTKLQTVEDVDILGIFDDRDRKRTGDAIEGCQVLGSVKDLLAFCLRTRVDYVIVSLPMSAEDRLLDIVGMLWELPVHIRLSAHASKLPFRPHTYSFLGDVPLLDIFDRPISEWSYVAKSVLDSVLATIALILLSPLMLMVAIAIKLDSRGPVFFVQKRMGFNNALINVYKFRSLKTECEDRDGNQLVSSKDDRVTRVGRFIRRTSIDELPQLINVLKGDLSLVGPRPHALGVKAENKKYEEIVRNYHARHRVKPGMTGWAQVNGWRGETDSELKVRKRVEHDLYYIDNWSLKLDLRILLATPRSLFKHRDRSY